jgi:hypothetical protein
VAIETPERISIDTADPDEAHSYLQTTYVEHSVRLTGSRDHFRFRHHITDGGNFFVARYEHSMNCQVDTDPFGFLLMGQVARGRLRLRAGEHHDVSPGPGELFLIDPHTPMRINWEDFKAGLVKLDLDVVQRVAAETTGDPSTRVRFGLCRAVSAERARHWQNLVRYVTHDFCGNALAYTSPLIYGQTMRLLAATVLETFPNTTMGVTVDRPGGADVSAVRRAVAYIEDHAAEPIGLAEIAGWAPAPCKRPSAGTSTPRRSATCGGCGSSALTTTSPPPTRARARPSPRSRRAGASPTTVASPRSTRTATAARRARRCAANRATPP